MQKLPCFRGLLEPSIEPSAIQNSFSLPFLQKEELTHQACGCPTCSVAVGTGEGEVVVFKLHALGSQK